MELVQTKRMLVAQEVLRILATLPGPRVIVEGFVNCREQGYNVSNYHVAASVSEDRSSDNIVVQYGRTHHFSPQGNVLRVEDGEQSGRRYFDSPAQAAYFIAAYFLDHPCRFAVASTEENMPFVLA